MLIYQKCTRQTEYLTIDEQLYSFRDRTKFTHGTSHQSQLNTELKYDGYVKCLSENACPLNGLIYTGKTGNT